MERQRTLFIAVGTVTSTLGETNIMLDADTVLPVAAGRALSVRNHGEQPAKVLALLLPPSRVEWRLFVPDGSVFENNES